MVPPPPSPLSTRLNRSCSTSTFTPPRNILLAAISSIVLLGAPASSRAAVTRNGKWSTSEVPVYVNAASFEARGFGAERARQQVQNAMNIWNVEGQANIRLTFAGDTTATSGQSGRINVWAGDVYGWPGTCRFATAVYTTSGGTCNNAGIEIYWRGFDACGYQPIDWTTDGPATGTFQLADILVHELGHVIGGYSDDYGASDTVMGSATTLALSYHLYDQDINLLRDGYQGNHAYGGRTNYFLKNSWSTTGLSRSALGNVGATNLKAGAASDQTHIYAAFVDATSSAFNIKVMRSLNGATWTNDTGFTSPSRVGVDLERTPNYIVLAFVEPGLGRAIKIRRRSSSWGGVIAVSGAASRVPPALAWNSAASRLLLFFVERDTHRLMYAVSADQGATWTTPAAVEPPEQREFLAVDGPAVGCSTSNQCYVVWPTFNTYNAVTTSLCTRKFTMSGSSLLFGDHSCFTTNSADPPGVAYGVATYAGWMLARAGRDSNHSLAFHRRSDFSVSSEWPTAHVSGLSSRSGVALDFLTTTSLNEWEVFYVSP